MSQQTALLAQAERLFNRRQYDALTETANLIIEPNARNYYLGLSQSRSGQGSLEQARYLLEKVGGRFKARALLALGEIGSIFVPDASGPYYCIEALKCSSDLYTKLLPHVALAVGQDVQGDSKAALRLLENLWPVIKHTKRLFPKIYYNYLNSLSVVYTNLGFYQQAWRTQCHVLQSPLLAYHTEWIETAKDCFKHVSRAELNTPQSLTEYKMRKELQVSSKVIPMPQSQENTAKQDQKSITEWMMEGSNMPLWKRELWLKRIRADRIRSTC